MSDQFHVDIPKMRGFLEAMNKAPQTLRTELFTAVRRISFRGSGLSTAYLDRHDTGHLAGTIFAKPSQTGETVTAMYGASAAYALPVDQGRKAGSKMPPQGALLPWMTAHGIPASAEFAVRKKIARDGIPAHPFVSKAHKELKSTRFYAKEFGDAIKRTLAVIRGRGL
jgi:hypothetical protein